jgi:hypothetical protein
MGYALNPLANRGVIVNIAAANETCTTRSAIKPLQEASNEHTDGFHQL